LTAPRSSVGSQSLTSHSTGSAGAVEPALTGGPSGLSRSTAAVQDGTAHGLAYMRQPGGCVVMEPGDRLRGQLASGVSVRRSSGVLPNLTDPAVPVTDDTAVTGNMGTAKRQDRARSAERAALGLVAGGRGRPQRHRPVGVGD